MTATITKSLVASICAIVLVLGFASSSALAAKADFAKIDAGVLLTDANPLGNTDGAKAKPSPYGNTDGRKAKFQAVSYETHVTKPAPVSPLTELYRRQRALCEWQKRMADGAASFQELVKMQMGR